MVRKYRAAALLIAGALHMNAAPKLVEADFGKMPDGAAIHIYTLTNKNGVEARITNYGGRIVSLKTPDRNGAIADIVLGFDSLSGYIENPGPFFGTLGGPIRESNRACQILTRWPRIQVGKE